MYFGEDVDQAIVLFQLEDDVEAKNNIFINDIKPAFDQLIKYHFFRLPASIRDEEMVHDCLSDLYEKINKFDRDKHNRAFPYFNVITKHFFIQKLKKKKKKAAIDKSTESLSDYYAHQESFDEHLSAPAFDEKYEKMEFLNIFKDNLPKWRDQFNKDQEKVVVDALISLFKNVDKIELYNKKAIFFYLKEMTGLNSKQIATNLNKIKKKFTFLKKQYNRGGIT